MVCLSLLGLILELSKRKYTLLISLTGATFVLTPMQKLQKTGRRNNSQLSIAKSTCHIIEITYVSKKGTSIRIMFNFQDLRDSDMLTPKTRRINLNGNERSLMLVCSDSTKQLNQLHRWNVDMNAVI